MKSFIQHNQERVQNKNIHVEEIMAVRYDRPKGSLIRYLCCSVPINSCHKGYYATEIKSSLCAEYWRLCGTHSV